MMQAFFKNVLSPVGIIVSLILIGLMLLVVISMARCKFWNSVGETLIITWVIRLL